MMPSHQLQPAAEPKWALPCVHGSMSYSFGRGGGILMEFCVCLCVGWVCAVLSVVGLGALLGFRVRVLGLDSSLCA